MSYKVLIATLIFNSHLVLGSANSLKCTLSRPEVLHGNHWPRFRSGTLQINQKGDFEFEGDFYAFEQHQSSLRARGISKTRLGVIVQAPWKMDLLATEKHFVNLDGKETSSDTFPQTLGRLLITKSEGNSYHGKLNDISATSASTDGHPAAEGSITAVCAGLIE